MDRKGAYRGRMSFEEIFNPSLSHAKDYLNAEKILPAPTPAAGAPPLLDGEGSVVYIPQVTSGIGELPDPPKHRKSTKKKASTESDSEN